MTPELGNMLYGNSKIQEYRGSLLLEACLSTIRDELDRVMWNIYQEEYANPFSNTGNKFKNDVFEVSAYDWDNEQECNFKYKDIEVSWYKYFPRDLTVNKELTPDEIETMLDECVESILEIEKEFE